MVKKKEKKEGKPGVNEHSVQGKVPRERQKSKPRQIQSGPTANRLAVRSPE